MKKVLKHCSCWLKTSLGKAKREKSASNKINSYNNKNRNKIETNNSSILMFGFLARGFLNGLKCRYS